MSCTSYDSYMNNSCTSKLTPSTSSCCSNTHFNKCQQSCNCDPCNGCKPYPPCPPCPPTPVVDCKEILARYHELIKQAQELYNQSDKILTDDLLKAVCYAVNAINQIFALDAQADAIVAKADALLVDSGCNTGCNMNSCKGLLVTANEYYAIERRNLNAALELLRGASQKVNNAICYEEQGDKYIDQYIACVHGKTPSNNCGC